MVLNVQLCQELGYISAPKGMIRQLSSEAESMPDEDDCVFYEVSLSNEDSFLVTGNLKHYPTSPRVITPAEFINII